MTLYILGWFMSITFTIFVRFHKMRLTCIICRKYFDSLQCYKEHVMECPDLIGYHKPIILNRKKNVGSNCKNLEAQIMEKYTTTTTTPVPTQTHIGQ